MPRISLFSIACRPTLRFTFLSSGIGGFFLGVIQLGLEADHLHSFSAGSKNAWSYH
jgi:hypothetical protein